MATEARVYIVTTPKGKRLVRAISQTAAIRHVVEPEYAAEVGSMNDVLHLVGTGIKVEDAKGELRAAGAAT
jgi:hypothetical protein